MRVKIGDLYGVKTRFASEGVRRGGEGFNAVFIGREKAKKKKQ